MAGHALQFQHVARRAGDRGDYTQRETFFQQHRTLFDMHFDIGGDLAEFDGGIRQIGRIEIGRQHRFAHRDALVVDVVQHAGIETAGDGATAQQRCLEAHAFFAKRDDYQRIDSICTMKRHHIGSQWCVTAYC